MLDEQPIRQALSRILDPELSRPLTELDMVRFIRIDGDKVTVGIALTVGGCPQKDKIRDDIINAVSEVPGVKSVTVDFDVMTDQQRARLKTQLGLGSQAGLKPVPLADTATRFVAVASGKGGVGKSTVTSNLATALARLGHRVGLVDADVYGFSIPRMLGITCHPTIEDEKIIPATVGENLQVVSMGFFVGEDDPIIWRGPLLHKTINQFLSDVAWSDLDYMLLDLPPGTGDVTLTIAQSLPSAELLVVTTPQAVATHVAARVAKLAERTNLRLLGVIENMAYLERDGRREYIFGKDGGRELATKLGITFLGQIPLMQTIREAADTGRPVAVYGTPDEVSLFENLARAVQEGAPR
ncbi:MAG TPA: Mrp/NBP35 family ATP-binding protein [Acidobacteriota bacterium]|nr:Mrp/NBP35 family ATP-binding protein [Acidobacteriota bacterium]